MESDRCVGGWAEARPHWRVLLYPQVNRKLLEGLGQEEAGVGVEVAGPLCVSEDRPKSPLSAQPETRPSPETFVVQMDQRNKPRGGHATACDGPESAVVWDRV